MCYHVAAMNAGILILIRHGQSQWNLEDRFTGWIDVSLTDAGREEARRGAAFLRAFTIDRAFTSALQRAQETLSIVLKTIGQPDVPVERDKALNERHYGDLQGLNKAETAAKFGAEQVHLWRRSYNIAPPHGESLQDTAARTLPYFKAQILPLVKAGKTVLVSAHGNSLRAIVMDLDHLTPDEVTKLELATGAPIVYELDERGKVLKKTVHQLPPQK